MMDWLIQEAAKDLVNAEEEAMGEVQGGDRREDEDGVGEEGGPARMDEDLPEEEDEGVKGEEGVEGEAGRARSKEPLPEEGVGEKQGRVPETVFRDASSADTGVGEDAEITLKGEEQGGVEGRAPTGEGERCLRLGLKAEV